MAAMRMADIMYPWPVSSSGMLDSGRYQEFTETKIDIVMGTRLTCNTYKQVFLCIIRSLHVAITHQRILSFLKEIFRRSMRVIAVIFAEQILQQVL